MLIKNFVLYLVNERVKNCSEQRITVVQKFMWEDAFDFKD